MRFLPQTFDDPRADLALDEALLYASDDVIRDGLLRIWEPAETIVVVGRGSRAAEEVRLDVCRKQRLPVLRRTSGGAAIVSGPGCIMFSLVFNTSGRCGLTSVDKLHAHVLSRMATALSVASLRVARVGISDLAVANTDSEPLRKFSGNSLRLRRDRVLYHGTILFDFALRLIDELLRFPPRTPAYRANRSHGDFVTNLPLSRKQIQQRIVDAWQAHEIAGELPVRLVAQLVAEKYASDTWNLRH